MDPIKAQKVRAMNRYKKSDSFFQSLILHSLLALACSLFCSYSNSFPNSFYTIKHLLFNSLPNTWSWFVNPSCLFVVVNFIVVFLIGESRISGKQSSSPADPVYDEYVARTRSLRGRPSTTVQEIKKEEKIVVTMDGPKEDNANGIEDRKEVDEVLLKEESDSHDEDFEECEENVIENEKNEEKEEKEMEEEHEQEKETEMEEEHEQQEEKEQEKEEEEEAVGIPAEELNKRIEDFIARVNKQRLLEARFLISL